MVFSYNWLQSFFEEKLPEPKKIAELITLRLFEVEEIEKKKKDWAIDIDVLPNRAGDCFSHIGIANEISAILGIKTKINKVQKQKTDNQKTLSLEVKSSRDCPRYNTAIIQEVKVKPSPLWLQERLQTCGIQSINNIVDAVNYAMLETGQPMHAFDSDKISKNKIIVRRANPKEEIVGLDNKRYFLDEDVIVISDPEKVLGIAGIKGGKNAEINQKTERLILESANFDGPAIRKASAKLKLRTDASLRFEHGMDPNLVETGLNRATDLICQIAGGKVVELKEFYPVKIGPIKIDLNLNYLNCLLGIKIEKSKSKKILNSLGFKLIKESGQSLKVEVPTQRTDVALQEDLIEEIGRIYGYEKIKPSLPEVPITPPKKNESLYWRNKIKNILESAGFSEAYNYSFISQNQADIFTYNPQKLIEVEKPISLDQKYLRPSLVPHLLKNIKDNEKHFKKFQIFEFGRIFNKNGKIEEREEVAGIISSDSFYEIKGILELLLERIGLDKSDFTATEKAPDFFHLNKRSQIISKSDKIGFLGKVSSKVLNDLKIKSDVTIFVLDFEKIKNQATDERHYKQISKFPSVTRDLSIIVPSETEFKEILKSIAALKISLIDKIDLFDVYQGKEISENKKSLALRLIYRNHKKTLTAEEVNVLHQKIIKKIEDNKNWQVRK